MRLKSESETANFAFNMVDLLKDLESFDEACNHPEADEKIRWRRAISREFEEMKDDTVSK